MGKSTSNVQIPGAPAAPEAPAADTAAAAAGGTASPDTDLADRIAALEAENRRLAAQVAASQGAGQTPSLVMEADGPNGRRYKAESKHLHMTAAELDAAVRNGDVKLTDHHVLCKDGWYVNPSADREVDTSKR